MKRLLFVGINNKPGLKPLDSSTLSGKRIDAIISGVKGFDQITKTNLFDLEFEPKGFCRQTALQEWIDRNFITEDDRIVALGSVVGECFKRFYPEQKKVVFIKHPSRQHGLEYTKLSIILINRL